MPIVCDTVTKIPGMNSEEERLVALMMAEVLVYDGMVPLLLSLC